MPNPCYHILLTIPIIQQFFVPYVQMPPADSRPRIPFDPHNTFVPLFTLIRILAYDIRPSHHLLSEHRALELTSNCLLRVGTLFFQHNDYHILMIPCVLF